MFPMKDFKFHIVFSVFTQRRKNNAQKKLSWKRVLPSIFVKNVRHNRNITTYYVNAFELLMPKVKNKRWA